MFESNQVQLGIEMVAFGWIIATLAVRSELVTETDGHKGNHTVFVHSSQKRLIHMYRLYRHCVVEY